MMNNKTQLDFARETRRLEKKSIAYQKLALMYAMGTLDELQKSGDISAEDHVMLLECFISDFADEKHRGNEGKWGYNTLLLHEYNPDLFKIYESIRNRSHIDDHIESVDNELRANTDAWLEWQQANMPKSPLLPN